MQFPEIRCTYHSIIKPLVIFSDEPHSPVEKRQRFDRTSQTSQQTTNSRDNEICQELTKVGKRTVISLARAPT